ncbi:cupin domain-containing protein [Sphingomonas sp. GB1N7]|uniref:cupin domain-containing protein n=1 Tax=Parasphingomonas caseinilytica TaxID=3096158 RepID=UPI002FC86D08
MSNIRRIVTGHNAAGKAIIQSDAPPTRIEKIGPKGPVFYEIWSTRETPAKIDKASGEYPETGLILPPPPGGTRIRVLDIPPETEDFETISEEEAREHFAAIGMEDASTAAKGAPHPFMHRTQSIDYGIVIEGELVLIMDEGETICRPGDIVVQRGTNHAWSNRSDRNCRIAFILIDGEFADGLV